MADELPEISRDVVGFAARKLAGVDRDGWRALSDDARRDYRAGAKRVMQAERTFRERAARQDERPT